MNYQRLGDDNREAIMSNLAISIETKNPCGLLRKGKCTDDVVETSGRMETHDRVETHGRVSIQYGGHVFYKCSSNHWQCSDNPSLSL